MSATSEHAAKIYPKPGTQSARFLADLLEGRRIDPLTAWRRLGIYRISDATHKLRHRFGWAVENVGMDVTNRFGEACHVALYALPDAVIEAAGERGRQYVAEAGVGGAK